MGINIGNGTQPNTADELLKENINSAIQKWQNASYGQGNNPKRAAEISIEINKVFANDLSNAISIYIKSLKINILSRTRIISSVPIWPWTPITLGHNAFVSPSDNHGYLDNFPIVSFEKERATFGNVGQYADFSGASTNKI